MKNNKWIYIGVGAAIIVAIYLVNLQRKLKKADEPVETNERKQLLIMEIIALTKEQDTPAVRQKYMGRTIQQLEALLEALARPSEGEGPDPADTTGGGMSFGTF